MNALVKLWYEGQEENAFEMKLAKLIDCSFSVYRTRWCGSYESTTFPRAHNYTDCQAFNFLGCMILSLRTACFQVRSGLARWQGSKADTQVVGMEGKSGDVIKMWSLQTACSALSLAASPSSKPHLMICLSLIVTGEQLTIHSAADVKITGRLKIKVTK